MTMETERAELLALADRCTISAQFTENTVTKATLAVVARAICRSDHGPGVPSCVMDDHPEREPCNETNCRRFEQAREVLAAIASLRSPAAPDGRKEVAVEELAFRLAELQGNLETSFEDDARAFLSKFTITPKVQS